MANDLFKGSGAGDMEWVNDFILTGPTGSTLFKVAKTTGLVTLANGAVEDGVLKVDATQAGTGADTTEDTLFTYTIPAGAIIAGQGIRVKAWGSTSANANLKTLRMYYGATKLVDTGAVAVNNKDWSMEAILVASGASAETCYAEGQYNGAVVATTVTAPAEIIANAIIFKVTGQNGTAAANDLVYKGCLVEWI